MKGLVSSSDAGHPEFSSDLFQNSKLSTKQYSTVQYGSEQAITEERWRIVEWPNRAGSPLAPSGRGDDPFNGLFRR